MSLFLFFLFIFFYRDCLCAVECVLKIYCTGKEVSSVSAHMMEEPKSLLLYLNEPASIIPRRPFLFFSLFITRDSDHDGRLSLP